MRVAGKWILIDPTLGNYVGPVDFFGPRRLTPLPFALAGLPRIEVVLISHDHFDYLDHRSIKLLAVQAGGPPRFLVPRGVGAWFAANRTPDVEEFDWWSAVALDEVGITFLPAQHGSGRRLTGRNRTLWGGWRLTGRNRTLWGGWRITHDERRFYSAPTVALIPPTIFSPPWIADARCPR